VHVPGEDAARAAVAEIGPLAAHAHSLDPSAPMAVEPDDEGRVCPPLGSVSDAESVRIVDASDPGRIVLQARLASPGLVVLADTYYPGWSARVDGAHASIFPADLLFRAVFVPPGMHEVVLTYAPRSLALGVLLCLVGAVVCLGLLTWPAVRTRLARSET
jgi:hypothetical protein